MSNVQRSLQILQELADFGVQELVVCAGARNAPLVEVLGNSQGLKIYSFFEERSAGFFALGRMQLCERPVVVLTTSGTAVAEVLPAMIEAEYSGLPLVMLSADRPRAFRGTGSPQTIVQTGLFSHYVEKSWDLGAQDKLQLKGWSGRRPIHINVCFDEPLIDEPVNSHEFQPAEFLPQPLQHKNSLKKFDCKKPLIVVGGLSGRESEALLPSLRKCEMPMYLEGHSQLRGHPALQGFEWRGGEQELCELLKRGETFDSVIRLGRVPTLRLWRDLEKSRLPVVHFSNLLFPGLTRGEVSSLAAFSEFSKNLPKWQLPDWEKAADERLAQAIGKYPLSEPALFHALSKKIPQGSHVFLGNSLPIREWDLAASYDKRFVVFANRGVNGIDGLISTFIGLADEDKENWAIIGDLSALYDMAGPWAARVREVKKLTLVVVNNGGGRIFEKIFSNTQFVNPHQLEFSGLAKLWGWGYQRVLSLDEIWPVSSPRLIELIPNEQQTKDFWGMM